MIYLIFALPTLLLLFLCLKFRKERNFYATRAKQYKRAYNDIVGEFNAMFASNFSSFIEKFFEGTEVTNYSIQVSRDKIDLKIGDEEIMVKVNSELLVQDVISALEQAQLEWIRLKNGK